jgi:hypothetical protein
MHSPVIADHVELWSLGRLNPDARIAGTGPQTSRSDCWKSTATRSLANVWSQLCEAIGQPCVYAWSACFAAENTIWEGSLVGNWLSADGEKITAMLETKQRPSKPRDVKRASRHGSQVWLEASPNLERRSP